MLHMKMHNPELPFAVSCSDRRAITTELLPPNKNRSNERVNEYAFRRTVRN